MSSLLRRVDLAELRAFCVAVELGSLGRAARTLQVSQPALSKRIRGLETLAGAPLLERSTRGVQPTAAGERLYAEARRLLAQSEQVEDVLESLHAGHAPIRLAASHTIAEYLLPAPLSEYRARQGHGLAVELVVANSSLVYDLVREGRAHFGMAACQPVEDAGVPLEEIELCPDEVVAAVAPGHPWAALDAVPLHEFLTTPMVMRDPSANTRRTVESVLRHRGLTLAAPVTEVGSTAAALAAAAAGAAPALLSRLAIPADGPLVARQVDGLRFPRRFVGVWRAREALEPSARMLVDYLAAEVHNRGLGPPQPAGG